ncbi:MULTISPECIES: histidine kinase [Thiorhodovibrio]|uniref:histidine kinase n=1 Tax=Thiorhodovibrio TaxID=61593 RepID=UPI001914D4F0|nr:MULTISPECIES: histidine kinase [Thiorhodovibrio]MBK5969902.1 histidine kinase [Thiorhodovibrio winogradskyi]WPL12053.1 Nitrate/nitrite sensor protein NarX [Thiorhodovibrio litoralis]
MSTDTASACGLRVSQLLRSSRLLGPLILIPGAVLVAGAAVLLHWLGGPPNMGLWPLVALGALAVALIAALVAGQRLCGQLLRPLANLEESVARVCQGEPGASESLRHAGVLAKMADDIGSLNAELTDLYEDMDARVARQTTRLAQKTASLKILYDVAAGITTADGLEEMLLRFLRVLKEMVNGRAATVRLLMPDGQQRLVGSIGLDNDLVACADKPPVDLCLCGTVLVPGEILCDHDAHYCSRIYGRRMFASDEIEVVTVPLQHHDELFGAYTIFVDRPGVSVREDILELLRTIGQHIGVAIAKHRSDAEARRLSIVEERSTLAHELHDSLAQTLASLRLKMRMLEDALVDVDLPRDARLDLNRIRNGIDEAHSELRELLSSFRAPLDRRGLLPALEHLAQRFRQETGISTFFQVSCRDPELSAAEELHVVRIAQESLNNIRKHADAQNVRMLLMREPDDFIALLIEDDGVGFSEPEEHDGSPGERIGLSILEERARRIGGELGIETEPGEGTRVELRFAPGKGAIGEKSVQPRRAA